FVGRDLEKTRKEPQSNRDQPDDQDTGTAKAAARQHAAQLVLPAAEQIFQVRGLRTWRRGARSPRPFRARAPGAAALITPRHQLPSTLAGLEILTDNPSGCPGFPRPRPGYRARHRPFQRALAALSSLIAPAHFSSQVSLNALADRMTAALCEANRP